MLTLLRGVVIVLLAGGAGLGVFWALTRPGQVDVDQFAALSPNVDNGALVFHAGGCASCHVDPAAAPADPPVLSGGYRIESPFGVFVAPNISPSQAGIGGWSTLDLANALIKGVSPDGQYYYPAFPYTTYTHMTPQDVVDLKAYLDTLPGSDASSAPHQLGFPFTLRRGLALWNWINLDPDWVLAEAPTPEIARGRYLAEALAHCGECHTPRTLTGGLNRSAWLTGAPNPSGRGQIPGITPAQLDWSQSDIAYYLETGFTPDFDVAGGDMGKVVNSMAKLPAEDRAAIAAYLKALP